jgi:hypothetical protein
VSCNDVYQTFTIGAALTPDQQKIAANIERRLSGR